MIEIRRWHEDTAAWHMVCRAKHADELRDDILEQVAMIDAAEGWLDGVGSKGLASSPTGSSYTVYYLSNLTWS